MTGALKVPKLISGMKLPLPYSGLQCHMFNCHMVILDTKLNIWIAL